MSDSQTVLKEVLSMEGISEGFVLEDEDRDNIGELEDEENTGVFECLKKKNVIVVLHDSKFRPPEGDLVKTVDQKVVFPAVPFSGTSGEEAIASSPSRRVHNFLMELFHMHGHTDSATIIIGFD